MIISGNVVFRMGIWSEIKVDVVVMVGEVDKASTGTWNVKGFLCQKKKRKYNHREPENIK